MRAKHYVVKDTYKQHERVTRNLIFNNFLPFLHNGQEDRMCITRNIYKCNVKYLCAYTVICKSAQMTLKPPNLT